MTGPEHYRAAEALLGATDETVHSTATMATRVAMAQAHATLALAAATAYPATVAYYGDESRATREWAQVAE